MRSKKLSHVILVLFLITFTLEALAFGKKPPNPLAHLKSLPVGTRFQFNKDYPVNIAEKYNYPDVFYRAKIKCFTENGPILYNPDLPPNENEGLCTGIPNCEFGSDNIIGENHKYIPYIVPSSTFLTARFVEKNYGAPDPEFTIAIGVSSNFRINNNSFPTDPLRSIMFCHDVRTYGQFLKIFGKDITVILP